MTKPLDELEKLSTAPTDGPCLSNHAGNVCAVIEKSRLNSLIKIAKAAHGLSFGMDWNKGTHAEIYRPKLIEALTELKGTK